MLRAIDTTGCLRGPPGKAETGCCQPLSERHCRRHFLDAMQAKLNKAGDVFRTGSEKTGTDRRALLLGTLLLRQCFCQVRQ